MAAEEMEILDAEEEIEDLDEDNENEVQEKKGGNKKAKEVVSKSFRDAIKNYLDQFAKENNLFAEKYKNQKKSVEECCTFIIQEVQKMQVNGLSDDEVYYLARHYYEEENLKVKPLPAGLKVVVNQHIELSEEEKQAAHQKALEDYTNAERKKLEDAAKKKADLEKKAEEKKKQKEQEEKLKRIEETKNEQFSIFDLLGEE